MSHPSISLPKVTVYVKRLHIILILSAYFRRLISITLASMNTNI